MRKYVSVFWAVVGHCMLLSLQRAGQLGPLLGGGHGLAINMGFLSLWNLPGV